MTTIEKQIYDNLAGSFQNQTAFDALVTLYAEARGASHHVYNKIDWVQLHKRIEEVHGSAGLERVRREAFNK